MKKGDVIKGYTILEDFSTAGGGLSIWSFARRGDTDYFIKQFLSPTYPTDDAPGGAASKAEKRRRCDAFERHHSMLARKLGPRSGFGGNLVVTMDFFRSGAKYYKVTEKVDVKGLKKADIAGLSWPKQKRILLTVAHSLRILHTENVVHGDLKPDNILIKETAGGFVTKLIDFDNSYISGSPTPPEDTVGDQVYYSPELYRYITNDPSAAAADLRLPSDVFALGLIYVEFLTGALPRFDTGTYQYVSEAANDGRTLEVPELREPLTPLIRRMLDPVPARRPSITEVFDVIKAAPVPFEIEGAAPPLKGTLAARKPPALPDAAAPRPPLSGTLMKPKGGA